jgi:hypothetical protein
MPGRRRPLAELLDGIPLESRTGAEIVKALSDWLAKCPDMIEEICPGKRLAPKRMTPAERTRLANKAAAEASKAAADDRHSRVIPIIEKILETDPSASLAQIKRVLDNSGVTPVRSGKWNRASINSIMKRAGIRAKD